MTRSGWRPSRGDLAIAFGLAAVNVINGLVAAEPAAREMNAFGWFLNVVSALVLIWRRRFPVPVLLCTAVAGALYYPFGYPDTAMGLATAVAMYTVAVECRRTVVVVSALTVVGAFTLSGALRGGGRELDPEKFFQLESGIAVGVLLLIVIAFAEAARNRRAYTEAVEQRAVAAERGREEEALRRATEERLRIARELHDVLAHQISLINVQAGAALHRRDDPARAYAALDAIKGTSKETLRELRAVLGVLRQVDADSGAEPAAPAPSLARLEELLAQTTAAGLPVTLAGPIPPAPLPAPVELAAYRIVQEALTNAVRHAQATAATVTIEVTGDAVVLRIDDDGKGPASLEAMEHGNGLRGMRERAATVGGEVTAAAGPAGGFRVSARLPLREPSERTEGAA